MKHAFLFVTLILIIPFALSAYNVLNGNISGMTINGPQTWYVNGHVTVDAGTTVTIEPSVVLKFAGGVNFYCYGDIVALGTNINPIYFTSKHDDTVGQTISDSSGDPQPGNWYGIELTGDGDFAFCTFRYGGNSSGIQDANLRANGGDCEISYCNFEHSDYHGFYSLHCSPNIQHSTFSNNDEIGAYINQDAILIFNDNTLDDNGSYAAYIGSNSQIQYGAVTGNSGEGNGLNGIGMNGNFLTSHLQNNDEFPFILDGSVICSQDNPLTIYSGTVIKANPNATLTINSGIDVNGTSGEPVAFTSIKDDAWGGDTNNDDDGSTPEPGDWFGIVCSYTSEDAPGNGDFDYCHIRYAGDSSSNFDSALYFAQSANAVFRHGHVDYSETRGLRAYQCSPVITNNSFIGNFQNGVFISGGDSEPIINDNIFNDNQHYASWINGCRLVSYSGNTGSGNLHNGFAVRGNIYGNVVWTHPDNSFPFILNSTTTVHAGASLTLPAGTIIKADNSSELYCYGTLDVNGTAGNMVVITSIHDDTFGGDTDGAETDPAPGDWYGIYLNGINENQGAGTFDYCRIRYGGNTYGNPDANVFFYYSDECHFYDGWIEYSSRYGIRGYGCDFNVARSIIDYNQSYGIYASGTNTHPYIEDCAFHYNDDYAALLNGTNLYSYEGFSGYGNGINGFGLSGNVIGNVTWTQSSPNFPFVVNTTLTVPRNHVLNLPPGTTLKVGDGIEITAYGTINAIGTEAEPIAITSLSDDSIAGDTNGESAPPEPGRWLGIRMYGAGDDQGIGRFDWCRVRYGGNASGYSDANIRFYMSDSCYVRNSTIDYSARNGLHNQSEVAWFENNNCSNNVNCGIYSSGVSSVTHMTDNTCNDNEEYGIYISNGSLIGYSGNTGTGNDWNGFALYGTVSESATWVSPSPDYPFVHTGAVIVPTGVTLEIAPGSIIKSSAVEHTINGTLLADGTPAQPIVFTSLRDDTYGGDTNGTEDAPFAGEWMGYFVSGNAAAEGMAILDNCVFRYGGNRGGTSDANLYLHYDEPGSSITNCTFEHSGKYGVRAHNTSATIDNCTIQYSVDSGMYATGNTALTTITDNNLFQNGNYGVQLSNVLLNSYSGNTGSENYYNGFGLQGVSSGNITWDSADASFPFILIGTTAVNAGDTLTFAPGTVVKSTPSALITVYGALVAESTSRNPIVFTSINDDSVGGDTNSDSTSTSPNHGDWFGINHASGSHGQYDNVRIDYAGNSASLDTNILFYSSTGWFRNSYCGHSDVDGLRIYMCEIEITNSEFSDNMVNGIYSYGASANPIIDNNSFHGNGNFGVYVNDTRLRSYSGNAGTGNGYNGFGLNGTLEMDANWSHATDPLFPFIMNGAIDVVDDVTLTLPAGTVLKAGWNSRMTVYGTLDANGTTESPVVVTSVKDDARAGNTDGDNGDAIPGDWDSIYIYGQDENDGQGQFDHTIIAYGGSSGGLDACLRYYSTGTSWFHDSICEHSAQHGILVQYCDPSILDSHIRYNTLNGIFCQYSTTNPIINDNQFTDNGSYAVLLDNTVVGSYSGNFGTGSGYNGFGVSGIVAGAATWSPGGSTFPYIMTGNITIQTGTSLLLAPAVVVKSQPGALMYVYGSLYADGSNGQEITFTSVRDDSICGDTNHDGSTTGPAVGDWYGIYVGGDAGNDGLAQFDYCDIRYGGNSAAIDANVVFYACDPASRFNYSKSMYSQQDGLRVQGSSPTITNSTFDGSQLIGLNVYGTVSSPIIQDNQFNDNGTYAIVFNDGELQSTHGNTGTGNQFNGMYLDCNVYDAITLSTEYGFPFILGNYLNVHNEATLTVDAGTVFKNADSGYLYVSGTLDINGTSEDPVIMTSIKDDTVYGDTNSDGSASTPTPGDWYGIRVYGDTVAPGTASLDHLHILYAGSSAGIDTGIHLQNAGICSLDNCLIEDSQQYGLLIENCNPTVRNSTIRNNPDYGVLINGNCRPNFGNLSAEDMGNNYIHDNDGGEWQIVNNSIYTINAFYNNWAYSDSTTIDAHIHDDDESVTHGAVLFSPWQSGSLVPPANVTIDLTGGAIHLTWDSVPGAVSYKIYHAQDPFTGDWGSPVASVAATHWEPLMTQSSGYYLVTSSDEPVRSIVPMTPIAETAVRKPVQQKRKNVEATKIPELTTRKKAREEARKE